MGFRTNSGFLSQQRTRELACFIMPAANGDGGVDRPAGVKLTVSSVRSTITV